MKLKSFVGVLAVIILMTSFIPAASAKSYDINELGISFDLPDTWIAATRTDYDTEMIKKSHNIRNESEWLRFMDTRYLLAQVVDDTEAQHEITISASISDEPLAMDYSEAYPFELELTAKASFDNNPNADIEYERYEVAKGRQTKYIVIYYKGVADSRNYKGVLYHTVMNNMQIEFDLTAFTEITTDYMNMFENAVLNTRFEVQGTENSQRLKRNLVYLALIVLAVAFIAVIVIFIVSKVKDKKNEKRALEEVYRARMAEQRPDNTGDGTDENGSQDTTETE